MNERNEFLSVLESQVVIKGALNNVFKLSFLLFHMSCKNCLPFYKYRKKNSEIPLTVKKSSVFVKHA